MDTTRVNYDTFAPMLAEVEQLLVKKGFLGQHDELARTIVLEATEAAELAQTWKRQGWNGKDDMVLEVAGLMVRAMNWWRITETQFDTGDAMSIRNQCIAVEHQANQYHWTPWDYFLLMLRQAVGVYSRGAAIKQIATCVVFCENFLNVPFTEAFRREMDKNWGREYQYNTAPEHFSEQKKVSAE
jgi:hypothetical protein